MFEFKRWRPFWPYWPLAAMLVFVFLYSLVPFDPRIRMGYKAFDPEFIPSWKQVWISITKWRHLLWFSLFFPLVREVFAKKNAMTATRKAYVAVLAISFLIEFQECFVAGRDGRLIDFLPNLMGARLGAAIADYIRRPKKSP